MKPELYRPIAVSQIGPAGLDFVVEATSAECVALARRMLIPAIQSLTCRFHLERGGADALTAHGHLIAQVLQTCVVSLDDFAATVEERFTVRCVPEGEESENPDPETLDDIPYVDGKLDLGEAAAEQLALALDPYPHAPGAVLPETETDPAHTSFASLAALKQRH